MWYSCFFWSLKGPWRRFEGILLSSSDLVEVSPSETKDVLRSKTTRTPNAKTRRKSEVILYRENIRKNIHKYIHTCPAGSFNSLNVASHIRSSTTVGNPLDCIQKCFVLLYYLFTTHFINPFFAPYFPFTRFKNIYLMSYLILCLILSSILSLSFLSTAIPVHINACVLFILHIRYAQICLYSCARTHTNAHERTRARTHTLIMFPFTFKIAFYFLGTCFEYLLRVFIFSLLFVLVVEFLLLAL